MAIACPPLHIMVKSEDAQAAEKIRGHGRKRLYPSLTDPSWLVLRSRRQIFQRWIARMHLNEYSVLDVGGRIQPYRELLNGNIAKYVALDLRATSVVDVNARAEQLPFADAQFDLVLCTQMLEYSANPTEVIGEIYRVLKQDGFLLLSVPSISVRDAEEDAWRFWPAAIRQLLASFSHSEFSPEGGSIAGFFRTMNIGLYGLMPYRSLRTLFRYTLVPTLNLAGLTLEKLIQPRNDAFVVNYSVLAQK